MNSIRSRLTLAFLGLAVVPLLIVGFIQISQLYRVQTQEAILLQREIAERLSAQVQSLIQGLESQLQTLINVADLLNIQTDQQRLVLSIFHSRQPGIDRLYLLDADGHILFDHSRVNLNQGTAFPLPQTMDSLTVSLSGGKTFFGPVRIDAASGEPLMIMVVPIFVLDSGKLEGMIVADVRLKAVWDLVARIRPANSGVSFIVDSEDRIIAHSNPSVVLRETRFDQQRADGIQIGQSGQQSVLVSQVISFGIQSFHVFVESPVFEALSLTIQTISIMLILVVIASLIAGSLGSLMVRRIVRPIEDIAASARAINAGDLSRRVAIQSRDELGVLAIAFNGMTTQLKALIDDLEKRVRERTQKLEAANNELEAFSYTVSHDLRAPLRQIDGYVDLLTSSCRADLDEKGLHFLDAIVDSTRQMRELINDLLQFSRIGRAEMRMEAVDMNQVLQEALASVQESCSGRAIEWIVGMMPVVRGDSILLRQVWINLLGNAVKFTRAKESARIEVGCSEHEREIVFVVADNGAGFDMKYADKLFNVFQRLHSEDEFEGSGIGLAIVRRIVERHGGRIWAEGEEGRGAKFSFTLPMVTIGA